MYVLTPEAQEHRYDINMRRFEIYVERHGVTKHFNYAGFYFLARNMQIHSHVCVRLSGFIYIRGTIQVLVCYIQKADFTMFTLAWTLDTRRRESFPI